MLSRTHMNDGMLKRYFKLKPVLLILAAAGIALIAFGKCVSFKSNSCRHLKITQGIS